MALNLNDQTSNGNTLTNVNTVAASADLPFATNNTNSASFTASSSMQLWAADSTSLSVTSSLTLQLWVKFSSLPSSGSLMAFLSKFVDTDNASRCVLFTLYNNSGTYQLRVIYSSDGSYQAGNDKSVNWTPSTATWYHLSLVIDMATPKVQFYVNGTQQGTDQTSTNTTINDNTTRFAIGCYNSETTPTAFFDGLIDDVRVWATARTSTQISGDYQSELTGTETNLKAYWPFETAPTTTTSTSSTSSSSSTSSTSSSSSTSSTSSSSSTSSTSSSSSTSSTSSSSSTSSTSSSSSTSTSSTSSSSSSSSTSSTSSSSSTSSTSSSSSSSTSSTSSSSSTSSTSSSSSSISTISTSSSSTSSTSSSSSSSTILYKPIINILKEQQKIDIRHDVI